MKMSTLNRALFTPSSNRKSDSSPGENPSRVTWAQDWNKTRGQGFITEDAMLSSARPYLMPTLSQDHVHGETQEFKLSQRPGAELPTKAPPLCRVESGEGLKPTAACHCHVCPALNAQHTHGDIIQKKDRPDCTECVIRVNLSSTQRAQRNTCCVHG